MLLVLDLCFFLSALEAVACPHEKEEREKAILFIRVFPFRVNKFVCSFATLCFTEHHYLRTMGK